MISKKYKVLEVRGNIEYVFDSFAFKTSVRQYSTNKNSTGEKTTMATVVEDIANKLFVSSDSVANWMYGRNGVSDLETVKKLAMYLGIDYSQLLKIQEKKKMVKSIEKSVISDVNMDRTKDVIRNVFQKMALFMDLAAREIELDYSEEDFYANEKKYFEAETALHLSMLDIPENIYTELNIIISDFDIMIHGYDCGHADIWDGCEYLDFLEKKELADDYFSRWLYMQNKSDEFYKKTRELLKDYITE